jgi:adenosylhomocysteine nucleosidase
MICFAFPLAHEAELLVKACTEREQFEIHGLHCTLGDLGSRRVLIARIGMGEAAAADKTETIFQYFRLKALILSGYGGALVPALKVGQVLVSTNYSSEAVVGFLRMFQGFDFANFVTVDEVVATREARESLAHSADAQVVDMETDTVANVVSEHRIPFLAVRAISDAFDHVLPAGALAAGFDVQRGQPTPGRLLAYLAKHPGEIDPFRKFVGNIGAARRNLTRFLQTLNNELPAGW